MNKNVRHQEGDRVCTLLGECGTVQWVKDDDYGHEFAGVLLDNPNPERIPSHMLRPEPAMHWVDWPMKECSECGSGKVSPLRYAMDGVGVIVYVCFLCGHSEVKKQ